MPFITLQELEQFVGADDVRMVTDEVGAFLAAEKGTAELIVALTGLTEPTAAADAPSWSKQPAAWLIYESLLGRAKNVSRETYDYWSRKATQAREMIALRATKETGQSEGGATVGKIENMPEW